MSPSELAGKRVLVVGLGVSGFSAAKALIELEAKVRVTEASDGEVIRERARQLRDIGVEVEVGGHDLERLDADLAVMSPGIPPTAPIAAALAQEGLELWSEVELAFRLARCEFLAVTGTNGKTTTTTLLASILHEAGVATVAAGNIGYPLIDAIASVPADGAIALEVSSFQLVGTERFRPRVAVLLNVAEDHTDWHGSFAAYRDAKARLVMNQTADDVFLPNADDDIAMEIAAGAPARVVPFSATGLPRTGIGPREGMIVWRDEDVIAVDDLVLPGLSGVEDSVAAAGAALEYGVDRQAVVRALRSFQPLGHRFQVVARADGITYIDDSKATNPHATLAALRGASNVVLIAGGRSKGIDLTPLRAAAGSLLAVIALGEAREQIRELFEGAVPVDVVDTMGEAVRAAAARSIPGGSVLLSPGCASLDMYESYAARGEDFARAVGELVKHPERGSDGDA
ncbi:MAG TPA: UDP-N-acetylmuramoyl-L-alanine--D-glutamate ligase [Actinomycetota bacterium]|nr:UDP-N-acetylmuramoyl-L-alanine--D-glutamate ligase [Actinomycetota bacterium]